MSRSGTAETVPKAKVEAHEGQPWNIEEETRLHELVESGASINNPVDTFTMQHNAIYMKLARMDLKLVVVGKTPQEKRLPTTTTEIRLKKIVTHEEAICILAGAIDALKRPDFDNLELQRLRILVDAEEGYASVPE